MARELLRELAAIIEAQHPRPRGKSAKTRLTYREAERAARLRPVPARATLMTVLVSAASPSHESPRLCIPQSRLSNLHNSHTDGGFQVRPGSGSPCSKAWGLHKSLVNFCFPLRSNVFQCPASCLGNASKPKNSMQICRLLFCSGIRRDKRPRCCF